MDDDARIRRWFGAAVAVALVVVGAFVVPRILADESGDPTRAGSTDCVTEADAPTSDSPVRIS